MKYNSIGQQLIAKAKELDPSYKPDKFNDMSEALNIILNNLDTYATFNDLHTLDIGAIASSSNIYQTLYQNVYENDTTKKNVVIFSTESFVDSATSLISAGQHIATPYQDNKILIDSVFVLNSDNSATSIVSSDTVVIDLGTLEGETGTLSPAILGKINDAISENKNITIKANADEAVSYIFPNVLYAAGAGLYATSILSVDETTAALTIVIDLSSGQYIFSNIEISGSSSLLFDLGTLTDITGQLSQKLSNSIRNAINDGSIKNAIFTFKYRDFQYVFSSFSIQTLGDFSIFVLARTINQDKGIGDTFSYIRPYCFSMMLTLDKTNAGMYIISDTIDPLTPAYIDLGNFTSLPVSSSQNNIYDVLMDENVMPIITYTLNNVKHYVYNKVYDTTNGYTFYEPLENNKIRVIVIHSSSNFQIFEEELGGGGGSATKMVNLGNLTDEGTLDAGKLQELITLAQNDDLIQVIFDYKVGAYITACAYSNDTSMGIVAYDVSNSLNVINLSLNITNGNYTITPIEIPTHFKTINGQTILGSGDLPITTDITYATDGEVNALFTNPGQLIPDKTISLENLNAFKQQIDNEINNEIGQVLEEGF